MAPRTYNKVVFKSDNSSGILHFVPEGVLKNFTGVFYHSDVSLYRTKVRKYSVKTPATTKVARYICRCGHVDNKNVCPECGNDTWIDWSEYNYSLCDDWNITDNTISTVCALLEFDSALDSFVVHFDQITLCNYDIKNNDIVFEPSMNYHYFYEDDRKKLMYIVDDVGNKFPRYNEMSPDLSLYERARLINMLNVSWVDEISNEALKRIIELDGVNDIVSGHLTKNAAFNRVFRYPEFLIDAIEIIGCKPRRLSSGCDSADAMHQCMKDAVLYAFTHRYLSIELFEQLMDYEKTNMLDANSDEFAEFFIKNIIQYGRNIFHAWDRLSRYNLASTKEYNAELLHSFISKRATEKRADQLVNGMLGGNPADAIIEFAKSL